MHSPPSPPTAIAFCITELDPGGAERALVQLVTRLDRSEWAPTVYCLMGRGALVETLERAGVPVVCFGVTRTRQLAVIARLARELRTLRPAILQTYLFHANIVGRFAARLAGVPHIVSGIRVAERRSRVPLWLDRWTNWMVDRNVCVSRAVADFSERSARLPQHKTVVIPNGVDVSRFAEAPPADLTVFGVPPHAYVFLCAGRLDPQKGHRYLFEASEHLFGRHGDLHLLVAGDGDLREELEEWVSQRSLMDRIHFVGWSGEIPALMRASDALVLPSLWEGMANVLLEAMAAGLPVVASRVEGTEEVVAVRQTGLIVEPRSSSEIAEAMEWLSAHRREAEAMGVRAQQLVQEHFTYENVVNRYEELYRELLASDS